MIPRLHIVTDDDTLGREGFVRQGMTILEAGGEDVVFHLRGPRTPGRSLYSLARKLAPVAEEWGALLLANDRVDLALALALPGAHLGQRSIPPSAARQILGPDRVLGLSIHGAEQAGEVEGGNVDFLFVGTIFPSSSHPGRTPGGAGLIRDIRAVTGRPILAIGGITPERIPAVLAAGGKGV
ncbi:MAG: thiamine phosphate synthase, partial [Gemmatimonadetes bacterium]|nr:thiamine phosphate synthase [Gemmatimonadota bacterium]